MESSDWKLFTFSSLLRVCPSRYSKRMFSSSKRRWMMRLHALLERTGRRFWPIFASRGCCRLSARSSARAQRAKAVCSMRAETRSVDSRCWEGWRWEASSPPIRSMTASAHPSAGGPKASQDEQNGAASLAGTCCGPYPCSFGSPSLGRLQTCVATEGQ